MKLSTIVGVLALCAVAYAADGVLLKALTPGEEVSEDQTQALEPVQPQVRQKRGLLLAGAAGLAGLGLLKAGAIGAGVVGLGAAGLVGAKAGLIGGALYHGHGRSYGGYGYGGGYGHGYYAPTTYYRSYPSYSSYPSYHSYSYPSYHTYSYPSTYYVEDSHGW